MTKTLLLFLGVSIGLNYILSGIHRLPVMMPEPEGRHRFFVVISGGMTLFASFFAIIIVAFMMDIGPPHGVGAPRVDWYPFLAFILLQIGLLWAIVLEANRTKEMQWKNYVLVAAFSLFFVYPVVMIGKPYIMLGVIVIVWLGELVLYRQDINRKISEY